MQQSKRKRSRAAGLHTRQERFATAIVPPQAVDLAACDRMDVNPDISAVREIIDDALNGRRVYAEAAEITRAA